MKRLLGVVLGNTSRNVSTDNKVSLLLPTFVVSEMKEEAANFDKEDGVLFMLIRSMRKMRMDECTSTLTNHGQSC